MAERVWSAPVRIEDVPEQGTHIEIEADAATREKLAKLAGVLALPRLQGVFDVAHHGRGLRVTGTVAGAVGQSCVVTLEPVENEFSEAVDLLFLPRQDQALLTGADAADMAEPPEELVGGMVDLGAIATEFLVLSIDPYPRKAGAVFIQEGQGDRGTSPFAALGALMKGRGGGAA